MLCCYCHRKDSKPVVFLQCTSLELSLVIWNLHCLSILFFYQGNVGDSRAIASKKGAVEQLSYDHKPSNDGSYTESSKTFVNISLFLDTSCWFISFHFLSGFRCECSAPVLSEPPIKQTPSIKWTPAWVPKFSSYIHCKINLYSVGTCSHKHQY